MIIDALQSEQDNSRTVTSARFAWAGGEFRLAVTVPFEFVARRLDASPFLCAGLLPAMRRGEDLEVRGAVSAPLLERVPRLVDLYSRWDPRLYRSRVRAEAALDPAPRAAGVGCFISRGVDSLYSAAAPRGLPGALTHLVFCDRLEPIHSERTRAEEIRIATEAATRLGRPLVVIESNIRLLTDPVVRDWEDMVGAGLSFLATSMSGRLGHVVIPSSDGPQTIGPCGTSPLLDPLFSTAEVAIHHDAPHTRIAKVGWLARERPDLLPHLKVCYFEDRPDNCGRCSKCLLTMLALEAAGALELATGFPGTIDRDALATVRIRLRQPREEFAEVEDLLSRRPGGRELAATVAKGLERAAATPVDSRIPSDSPGFRRRGGRDPAPGRRTPSAPRTTVMMAAYDADATLRESVDSVLSQTVGDLELLVVDDGSRRPVSELLADVNDARLRILRHRRNRGLSAARNTALAAASAALVSQLDADDLWERDYLESVLPCFDDPGVGLAYANCAIIGHPSGHEDYIGDASVHPIHDFPKLAEQNPVPCPTATMRTVAVRSAGGYARWLRQCEDHHLYLKLAQAGWRFAYVPRQLARYRWPEPGRGMSFNTRRHEVWEHAMFSSFVLRHPRTPGPRRQARVRAQRELKTVISVARRAQPPAGHRQPRLFVVPGSYELLNLGDIAMLQVCLERLRGLWPDASVGVITGAPERLAQHCPGARPVAVSGQHEWFEHPWEGGAYWPLLREERRSRYERAARRLSDSNPRTARLALRAELLAREPASDGLRNFAGWLLAADAVVVSGRGGTTDVFLEDGLQVLRLVGTATRLGLPTAMFSQGLGPLEDERLRALARQVLPRVDVLGVREHRTAAPLLDALSIDPGHTTLTGDDALELAHRARPRTAERNAIGVGLRLADYSGLGEAAAGEIGRVIRGVADRHAAELRPITISLYPHEADGDGLRHALDGEVRPAETPAEAIAEAGRCRVVVAGSYHAAVFALGQGVPVVGVSAAPYYEAKLKGLADLFPDGCRVLSIADDDFADRFRVALAEAWDDADEAAPGLLAAAERQIASGRDAYARFRAVVAREAVIGSGAQPGPGTRVSHSSVSSQSDSRYL